MRGEIAAETLLAFLFLLTVLAVLSAATSRFSSSVSSSISSSYAREQAVMENFKLSILSSCGGGNTLYVQDELQPLACALSENCENSSSAQYSSVQYTISGKSYVRYNWSFDVPI